MFKKFVALDFDYILNWKMKTKTKNTLKLKSHYSIGVGKSFYNEYTLTLQDKNEHVHTRHVNGLFSSKPTLASYSMDNLTRGLDANGLDALHDANQKTMAFFPVNLH